MVLPGLKTLLSTIIFFSILLNELGRDRFLGIVVPVPGVRVLVRDLGIGIIPS